MQKKSPQKYKFWADYSYGIKLIKGVTRDQVVKELSRYPLLMKHYKKNGPEIQTRIIDTLMKEPSPSDCPGFIYGFKDYNQHNKNPYSEKYEIKMGRTKKQVPQNRIYEWQLDDGHQYVEVFTIRSQFNNKLQALVHLFFAYARKEKIINGKRRIEWFNFQEKALNAAVTSLINQLMEKVHHLGKINESHKPTLSYDLSSFYTAISEEISSIQFLKKRLIIVGPKNSGKSVLRAMLNGEDLKVIRLIESNSFYESQNSFKIQLPHSINSAQNIIELSHLRNHITNSPQLVERFRNSFILWSSINSIQEIGIPCLVVTQNDLLSSQMIGFKKAFQNLLKYIRLVPQSQDHSQQVNQQHIFERFSNFKLFLVISKIQKDHHYTQQRLKKHFSSNKSLFLPHEYKILENSSIFFIPSPHQQGKLDYNVEKIIRQIQNYNFELMKTSSFEYFDPAITKICEETIHYAYEQVGQKYGGYFKSSMKKIAQNYETQKLMAQLELNEENEQNQQQSAVNTLELIQIKLKFINSVEDLLNKIKSAATQQQVLTNLKRMHLMLSIEGNDSLISQLLAFCECMLKLSTPVVFDQQEGQEFERKQDFSSVLSPMYLSNSLLFSNLDEKISQSKQEIREQVNAIIQNELKMGFENIVNKFYNSLDENTQSNKEIFNKAFDILFRMMNIDSAIESERIEKKLSLQTVSNEVLEQQILIRCVNQLLELSGGKGSVHFDKLRAIIKLISLVYGISREHKIRTINVVSRIRQAIFVATKGKKQVPMVNSNTQNNNSIQQKNQSANYKKPYYNNNKSNHLQLDSETKIILNKKYQIKNERLLNYINAKKKYTEQSQQIQISQQEKDNNNSFKTLEQKKQVTIIQQKKTLIIEIYNEETSIYPNLNQQSNQMKNTEMASQQEFFSMPSQGSDEDKNQIQKVQQQMKKLQIQQKSSQKLPIIQQDQFSNFVNQLINSFNLVKHKYSSIPSLKSLNEIVLFKILAQQTYHQCTFNFLQNPFIFDLPSITLHNSFVIIFAKKISVNNLCEINFKIHYKNRRPNKINFIMISEGYEGVQKLKIEDNKYGKVLMIEVLKKNEKKIKIHEGYYTKNKRNQKKLQDLRVNDLVESYCRIIN